MAVVKSVNRRAGQVSNDPVSGQSNWHAFGATERSPNNGGAQAQRRHRHGNAQGDSD